MRPRERQGPPAANRGARDVNDTDSHRVAPTSDTRGRPRRTLTVTFVNNNCATVSGYGSRDLLRELRGNRAPVWSTLSRAWVTVPRTARDLIAVAESRGYDVLTTDCDPGGGRW